ncbi:hypothetical protein GUJ93_ZPchr0013g36584 [Zizania palustris]|uniref:Uncharacterized protein n=1 Tax=Zizania palustris TaxID=103762 RepID=A0A8J5X3J3_ZIZPA|nr:hypothetical protein GUJ93_ZPchr0013g36584 [Zizania palustris]
MASSSATRKAISSSVCLEDTSCREGSFVVDRGKKGGFPAGSARPGKGFGPPLVESALGGRGAGPLLASWRLSDFGEGLSKGCKAAGPLLVVSRAVDTAGAVLDHGDSHPSLLAGKEGGSVLQDVDGQKDKCGSRDVGGMDTAVTDAGLAEKLQVDEIAHLESEDLRTSETVKMIQCGEALSAISVQNTMVSGNSLGNKDDPDNVSGEDEGRLHITDSEEFRLSGVY